MNQDRLKQTIEHTKNCSMIKYYNTEVVFEEIPNEVTLAVNITNCQHNCIGCHSPYLREDIGCELNFKAIDELIKKNDGITCFCFMGEGNDLESLKNSIKYIKENKPKLKIGLYSGRNDVDDFFWDNLNYIKIGPYIEKFGPLNERTTNQRMYKGGPYYSWCCLVNGVMRRGWTDITDSFWK